MKAILSRLLSICLLLPVLAFSAQKPAGVGAMANGLMEPVSVLTNFVMDGSMVVGIAFLFAAFVRYMQHRVNPLAAPTSSVVVLFIGGILLLLMPLAHKLTQLAG